MKPHLRETGREGVLRACLELLAAERIFHLRLNSGKVQTILRAWVQLCPAGTPDILFTYLSGLAHRKVVVWIETKGTETKHREAQKLFRQEAELRDEIYLLIRSVDELRQWLVDYGVIEKNRGMA